MNREDLIDFIYDVFDYNVLCHYATNREVPLRHRIEVFIYNVFTKDSKHSSVRTVIRDLDDKVGLDYEFLVTDEMLDVFLNDVLQLEVDSKRFDCKSTMIIKEDYTCEDGRNIKVIVIDER